MAFERFKTQARKEREAAADADYSTARSIDTHRPVETLRTDVAEMLGERPGILGGRFRLRADLIHNQIGKAEADKDKMGIRESYYRYSKDRTQLKIERVQEDMANSGNGFIARQINRQRRHTIKVLEYKQKVRKNQIEHRESKRLNKPEQLQKKIDELTRKMLQSMRRKAERTVLREKHGVPNYNIKRRAETLLKLTPDQKKHITREAILLVRQQNIRRGLLSEDYEVDDSKPVRKVGSQYDRVIE